MRTYGFLLKWTAPAHQPACIGIYKIVSEAVMTMKAVSRHGLREGVMDKRVIALLVAVLLLSGAAAASAGPAEPMPAGVWEGVITGREMYTGSGQEEQFVRLVVNDDGTWTMRTATWHASGRVTSRTQSFVLEGSFISSNPGQPLGPALFYLAEWGSPLGGNARYLGGNASALYKGMHITTGIMLEKVH